MPLDELPETNRSLRLGLHTDEHSALLYSASDISVWPREKLSEHPFLRKLGPDILNQAVTPEVILQRLTSSQFRKRSLAALYLDQAFLAGMGNYLRSEILFFAGIYPDKKPADLSDEQINHLAEQTLQVTYRSYETGGYTTSISVSVRALHSGSLLNTPVETSIKEASTPFQSNFKAASTWFQCFLTFASCFCCLVSFHPCISLICVTLYVSLFHSSD